MAHTVHVVLLFFSGPWLNHNVRVWSVLVMMIVPGTNNIYMDSHCTNCPQPFATREESGKNMFTCGFDLVEEEETALTLCFFDDKEKIEPSGDATTIVIIYTLRFIFFVSSQPVDINPDSVPRAGVVAAAQKRANNQTMRPSPSPLIVSIARVFIYRLVGVGSCKSSAKPVGIAVRSGGNNNNNNKDTVMSHRNHGPLGGGIVVGKGVPLETAVATKKNKVWLVHRLDSLHVEWPTFVYLFFNAPNNPSVLNFQGFIPRKCV